MDDIRMKNIERFENAFQFLSGFDLDWHDDYAEPEEIVAEYIEYADRRNRADTLGELRQILAEFQGPELNKAMLSICCFYSPERYRGVPMREWLDEVIGELERSLIDGSK
ncbi:MAG TPA: contact-dependent growth inhibition system immunity protein [Chthoniobacteraceae bacterium]|jgi:hypothetical protein|nr:contact-dependent growth inhibition system immunity protein [Chthoniobacteraceae bacterium]